MNPPAFRKSDLTKAMQACAAAGVENYDLSFDRAGKPIIRVRASAQATSEHDIAAELEAWSRAQED